MHNTSTMLDYINDLMIETAKHLKRSLDVYWPTNVGSSNDLPERNLSAHFSHVLLKRDFHLYAEIGNQYKPEKELLDILCISPDKRYHLACEFKTYTSGSMKKSTNDIERVNAFPINIHLPEDIFGENLVDDLRNCKSRIGVVAGVLWRGNTESKYLSGVTQSDFSNKVTLLGGIIGKEPILVKKYEPSKITRDTKAWCGAYYLYYAVLGDFEQLVNDNGFIAE